MKIDLGRKMEMPENPVELTKDTMYPSFYIRGDKELDIPEEGEMTIQFRKRSETTTKHEDGKTCYECCIDVKSIEEVEGEEVEAPAHSYDEAGEALDKLASLIKKVKE